jgi:uncharacterized protein YegP (UPF0339 family)
VVGVYHFGFNEKERKGGSIMGAKFEIFKDKSKVTGKAVEFRWRLIHTNGQVIANSGEGYTTKANAISGINSVKENAPNATVEDKTASK